MVQVGELFVAGDKDAFLAKFPIGPIITIVSLKASLRRCVFANSFPRNSSSFRLELFRTTDFSAMDNRFIVMLPVFFQSILAPCT